MCMIESTPDVVQLVQSPTSSAWLMHDELTVLEDPRTSPPSSVSALLQSFSNGGYCYPQCSSSTRGQTHVVECNTTQLCSVSDVGKFHLCGVLLNNGLQEKTDLCLYISIFNQLTFFMHVPDHTQFIHACYCEVFSPFSQFCD